jgi:protein O-mannosyl-transferase
LNRIRQTKFFHYWPGALLVLATVLAYLPALRCGYIWDDDVYVTGNSLLWAHDGLWRIWFTFDSPSQYFPLVYTTLRLEHALWGLAPLGYHCVNILLHATNAVLVWRLLRRVQVPGAWLAAAIFAVHPVQVESVAWVTELKNVEMGFFFLLTLHAWLSYRETNGGRKWVYYGLSLGCFALALFAKTTACTLPAAILVIEWLREGRIGWRRALLTVPYAAMGVGMGMLTVWWERVHQGTHGPMFAMGFPQRMVIIGRNVWFYLTKLVWPQNLTFSYPRWTLTAGEPRAWAWLAVLVLICAAAYFARRFVGRGLFAALTYFVATLSPVLGVLMLYTFRYSFVADHYQYLACIGPIALACAGGCYFLRKYPGLTCPGWGVAGFAVVALGALTWNQCHVYYNDETVWRDVVAKNPESLIGQFNLGNCLMRDGKYAESIECYNLAIGNDPSFIEARCNRAQVLAHIGRRDDAVNDYRIALLIESSKVATAEISQADFNAERYAIEQAAAGNLRTAR